MLEDILNYILKIDEITGGSNTQDIEGDNSFHVYDIIINGYSVNPYGDEATFPYR